MDEYEVDLIDYLRVVWRGKWLILACVLAALAVSAAVMWTQPNEFSGTTSYRIYQSLSILGISNLDKQGVVNTVLDFKRSYENDKLALTAEVDGDRIQVTLAGPMPPDTIDQAFSKLGVFVNEQLNQHVEKEVAQAVLTTSMYISQLTRQRDILMAQIKALDSPVPDDPLLGYLAQKASDVEAQLAQEQVKLESLNSTDPTSLFTLETTGVISISQIGPNRTLSVAVAVVLGLFFGVLLAFFVHYLISVKERDERPAPGKEESARNTAAEVEKAYATNC